MCFYARLDSNDLRLAVRHSGIGALEDSIIARYEMHSQIYGHKTNRACSAMLTAIERKLKAAGWTWYKDCQTLSALIAEFGRLDDQTFIHLLLEEEADNGKVKEIAQNYFSKESLSKGI